MLAKSVLATAFRLLFRTKGPFAQVPVPEGALIVANHVSYLDGLALAAFSTGSWAYASESAFSASGGLAARWLRRLEAWGVGVLVTLDKERPDGVRVLARLLRQGRSVVVFPQGRIVSEYDPVEFERGVRLLERYASTVIAVHIAGAGRTAAGRTCPKGLFQSVRLRALEVPTVERAQQWLEEQRQLDLAKRYPVRWLRV